MCQEYTNWEWSLKQIFGMMHGIPWDHYYCSFQKIFYAALGATLKIQWLGVLKMENGSGLKVGKCQSI